MSFSISPSSVVAVLCLTGAPLCQGAPTARPTPTQAKTATQAKGTSTPVQVAEVAPSLRKAVRQALDIKAKLSRPLHVNGVVIDPLELERQVVYLVGQRQMQEKLISMLIDDQIEQAIEAGKDKKDLDVLEDEVRKAIEKSMTDFTKQNPGKNFYEELRKTNTSKEEFETMQRNTILFDKIFFPGIPSQWPDITKEAIIAAGGPQGEQFFKRFAESVKEGQQVPPMFLMICRKWVVTKLQDWSDIRYASDGLPAELCMSVNGREWKTTEATRAVAIKSKPEDRARALIQIVLQTALKKQLEDNGAWLSDKQFKKEFEEYRKPYDETPFNVKVMALSFKGYPSFEAYKSRWRLERSFEHMIAKEINDDNLGKYLERAKAFLGDGRVSANMIRIPAFDDSAGTWKKSGFKEAGAAAEKVMAEIESGKITFGEAMAEYSKWPVGVKDQGYLANKSLNEFRTDLRETEYTDFISGYSVGEIMFYDVKAGHIAGPLRGQDAYYIGFLVDRQPPVSPVDLTEKNQRDLVKQDYLTHRFIDWANEVASKVVIR